MIVNERVNGKRIVHHYEPHYFFYYSDPNGKFTSIYGDKCSRFVTSSYNTYKEEIDMVKRINIKIFESDVKPTLKTLEEHYKGCNLPNPHIAYFDIETDYDPDRGFAGPEEAFMPITAISVFCSWTQKLHCLTIKPKSMLANEAQAIVDKFENTILCNSESQLLDLFLNLIEDADILTGWNSSSFDIPYIVHRIQKVRGKQETSRLCLHKQYPKKRTFEQYGDEIVTYDLIGRLHLDYLELYRKYAGHELPNYKLDYVAEIEVKENKIQYDGSLDELYNYDYEKFIQYSRQDTLLLKKIDDKLKYIDLIGLFAHDNLVTYSMVTGAVGLSDNAILLEIHNRNMVAPDRQQTNEEDESIAGAFVLDPKPGISEWTASVDMSALYPSTFRALNMSPETIVGQIQQDLTTNLFDTKKNEYLKNRKRSKKDIGTAELWSGVFEIPEVTEVQNKTNTMLKVKFDVDTQVFDISAKDLWDIIVQNNWILSANGTIFKTDIEGIIPGILTRWFNERKQYQKIMKEWINFSVNQSNPSDFIQEQLKNIKTSNLKDYIKEQVGFWDRKQNAAKLNGNSLYGALTNKGSRFYDQRMGQSCTLTGRCVTRHMGKKISEILTGSYDFTDVIVYGDTDSVAGDTNIRTNIGNYTIEQLFHMCNIKYSKDNKEYGSDNNIKILNFDIKTNNVEFNNFNYIYRHKTNKSKWKLITESGKEIITTDDHSMMVERDGKLIEVKPSEIIISDVVLSLKE